MLYYNTLHRAINGNNTVKVDVCACVRACVYARACVRVCVFLFLHFVLLPIVRIVFAAHCGKIKINIYI